MNRFTFLAEREGVSITKEIDGDTAVFWDEILTEFVFFLRDCGFYIDDGEWVENDRGTEADNSRD